MFVIYLFMIMVNSIALLTLDVDVTNWQYWVSLFCIIGAWICGREYGD